MYHTDFNFASILAKFSKKMKKNKADLVYGKTQKKARELLS